MHNQRTEIEKDTDDEDQDITLRTLLDQGYIGREVRYWLISTHYRKQLVFKYDRLEADRHSLTRIDDFIYRLLTYTSGVSNPELEQYLFDLMHNFIAAMDDDFNISAALASIFEFIKKVNPLIDQHQLEPRQIEQVIQKLKRIDEVLGIFDFTCEEIGAEVKTLLKQRDQAREEKNWEQADKIRDQLIHMGYTVIDTSTESRVIKRR